MSLLAGYNITEKAMDVYGTSVFRAEEACHFALRREMLSYGGDMVSQVECPHYCANLVFFPFYRHIDSMGVSYAA